TSEIEDLVGAREELYLARPAERALGGLVHLLGLRTLEDVTVDDVLGHIDDCRRAGEPTPRRVYAWLDRAFADGRLQVAQLAGRRWVYGDDGRYEHHTKVFGVPAPELFGRHRGYWWSGKSLCPRLWSALIPQEVTTEHVLEFVRELARPIAAEGDRAALARDAATEPAEGALPVLLESCLARLGRDDATIAPDLPVIPCLSRGPDGGGELRLLPARAPRLWRSDTPALEARFARVGGFFVTVRSSRHFLDLERLLDAMEIGFLSAAHVATVVRDRGRDRTSEYEDELEALRERLSTLCDALPRIEEMYRKQDSSRGDPARWVYRERLYPLAKTGAIRVHEPLVVSYALPGVGRFLDDSAHAAFDPHSNSLFATPALVEEPALRSLDLAKCLVPTVLAGTAESLIPTLQVLLQIGDPEGVARYLDDIGCPRARPIHDLRSRLIERVGDLLRAEVLRALRARFPALHAADLTAWQTGAWLRGLSLRSDDALDDALATAAARALLASAGLITPPPALVEALAELLAAPSLAAILDHLVPRTAAPAPAAPAVGGLGRPPPPAMDLSYTPRALPWPTLYVIARLHDRYDPQRHVWTQRAPPELAAHRAGPPGSARVWFQGQVQPGRHVLPLPLLSILDGAPVVEAGDGAAVVIGERRGLPELEVRAAGPVTLRYTARLLDRPGVAPTPVEPHLRAPTVELDALPPVARARVARLKELGSPWARAGAVADFVARYYRYDEDFLDDPQVLEVIREHPIGRGNRFLAALHAGGEGELLGRGMCTELNTLVVELLRHLGIPCVLAESWMLDGPPVQRPDHAFALAFLPEGDGVVPVPLDASLACGDPRAQPQRAPGTPTTPESYAPWQARMRSGELRVLDPVDLEREQLTKQQRALARVIELWSARKGVASPPRLKTIARIEDPARRLLETHALARALARDPLFAKALHFAGEASVDEWSRLVRELLQQRGRGLVFDLLEDLIAEGVVAISPTLARSLSDPDA
ncbi:MAG: hypothetical protein R3A51_17975, partial [Nannocystaceae bacterium]